MAGGPLPALALTITALFVGAPNGRATADALILPTGTLVAVYSGAEANALFMIKDSNITPATFPWAAGAPVVQTRVTAPLVYARFYDNLNSGPNGRWTTPASVVRGRSAAEVRAGLALPSTPTMMAIGVSSVGLDAYTGTAGPIAAWGEGGLQQTFLDSQGPGTGTFSWVINKQPIMDCILCYDRMATSANTQVLGRYLVDQTPAPGSDMDSVYQVLDTLFILDQAPRLEAALAAMGGARFDDIMTLWGDAVALQGQAVDGRIDQLLLGRILHSVVASAADPGTGGRDDADPIGTWIRVVGEQRDQSQSAADRGMSVDFESEVSGLVIGLDRHFGGSHISGLSVALMRGHLNWDGQQGRVDTDELRLAAYSLWSMGSLFARTTASLGVTDGDTRRAIRISPAWTPPPEGSANYSIPGSPFQPILRDAAADYQGWDGQIDLRGGFVLNRGALSLIPSLSLGYRYQSRDGFEERGAGALNLRVASQIAESLLAGAQVTAIGDWVVGPGIIASPYLQLGLTYRDRLDDQRIEAALNDWSEDFQSEGRSLDSTSWQAGAGITLSAGANRQVSIEYRHEDGDGQSSHQLRAGLSWAF